VKTKYVRWHTGPNKNKNEVKNKGDRVLKTLGFQLCKHDSKRGYSSFSISYTVPPTNLGTERPHLD
jgi:hypothetical protein